MNIQSASLDVPAPCPNNCKFCVTKLWRKGDLEMLNNAFIFDDDHQIIFNEFHERMLYLRQQNVDTIIFTGSNSEPVYNKKYLKMFNASNLKLGNNKFINIELQTSGIGLIEELEFLKYIGVKTISLSLASLSTEKNFEIMETPEVLRSWTIKSLTKKIKENGFNLRLSLNINKSGYKGTDDIKDIFMDCKNLLADQITFRELYSDGSDLSVAKWIEENNIENNKKNWWKNLKNYISENGRVLNVLAFGAFKYSIHGMSTVIDDDCMSKDPNKKSFKYLILRRNNRLYSEWDDPASLIF